MSAAPRRRVAFQGELGSFSDEAIGQLWGDAVDRLPCRDVGDVTAAVAAGDADSGVLPFENTMIGSIIASHDALAASDRLVVVAETVVQVQHCLLGADGASLGSVTSVLVHPVALEQCGEWFAAHPGIDVQAVYDTAGAAMDVSRVMDPAIACVASRRAAQHYGLRILAPDIQDRPDNQTRFLAVSRDAAPLEPGMPVRTLFMLRVADAPGALLRALTPLATHGVNIRRLESRPTGEPWTYRFFIEFDHAAGDAEAEAVRRELAAHAPEARHRGTFPRWQPGRRGSVGWTRQP